MTKTDVKDVSCRDLLESLFCSTGNLLGPLLLNMFIYCSLYLIFIKTWDAHLFCSTSELARGAGIPQKGGWTPFRSKRSTTHWEAESQTEKSCNKDCLHQQALPSACIQMSQGYSWKYRSRCYQLEAKLRQAALGHLRCSLPVYSWGWILWYGALTDHLQRNPMK